MARGQNPYFTEGDFVKPGKRFWPLEIPVSHWQLRHFISQSEPDHLYYASKSEVYCLNTTSKKRKLIAILPFDARCTASGYGWVCVGGGEDSGHFAAIKLDGSGDVDAALPIDAWRSERRPPSVKIESIGDEIVNSISIHRIQDEEAHLDDIVAVVTNNDKTVRLYSLPQGIETKVLHLPDPMNHATISPDGTMLVAVGDQNEAFFYKRVLKDKPPLIHKPHNRLTSSNLEWKLVEVCNLYIRDQESPLGYFTTAWSPDGQHVAVGSEGGYITLFSVASLKEHEHDHDSDPVVAVIPSSRADCPVPYVGSVRTMIFSPAPWDLLIWSEDQGRVCIGDMRSGLQRTQVLNLSWTDEEFKSVTFEHTTTENATQDEIEQLLQTSQRNLEELESDFLRRHRRPQDGMTPQYATEYLAARSRQREQRLASTIRAQQAEIGLADDPRGLSADEQQILDSLRLTRQREEARSAGRALGVNYTSAEALATARSSASSTPITADSSTRFISDTLSSMQESFPELSRTNAHPRPSSATIASGNSPPLLSVPGDAQSWGSRHAPHTSLGASWSPAQGLRYLRRAATLTREPSTSAITQPARSDPTAEEVEDEQNPWRTIQDAMSDAHGPLFEGAARVPAASPLPSLHPTRQPTVESSELVELQAIARRRNRLRNARMSLTNVRNGGIPDAYEAFRRRMIPNREMGVRTAGLAMSRDGSTLWAACEEGIFEFQMNRKSRMFWPAVCPR